MLASQAAITELLKLRRSKVPWFTLAALWAGVLGLALLIWVVKEPGRAAQLGLLGTKADFTGLEATWQSFAGFMVQIVGTGGMLLLAFIVAYVFGREYTDGTAKNMLALPVERQWFVVAKLLIVAVWWLGIVAGTLGFGVAVGFALGLPGLSAESVGTLVDQTLRAAEISLLLVPVIAWVTILGRGYMAPLGFALAMLLTGNLVGSTGWAPWFPWSIVPILVGSVGKPVSGLPPASYVVLALTFVVGVAGTIWTLRTADNTQ